MVAFLFVEIIPPPEFVPADQGAPQDIVITSEGDSWLPSLVVTLICVIILLLA